MIIFLNGTSSSGKSVIAREIMHQSERPFLYYSIDHLVNFWIDEKFVAFEDEPKAWFFQQHLTNIIDTQPSHIEGPDVDQLRWDMIEAFTVLIKKGYDLIIDEVLLKKEIFQHYAHALCHAQKVYLIKIICDLIESERREKLREDRYVGLTRSIYEKVYLEPPSYDLEVDTTSNPVTQSAVQILSFIRKNNSPLAFLNYVRGAISFKPLAREHFKLMHTWINTPHVNKWWGDKKEWTMEDIEEKYATRVEHYALVNNNKMPMFSFIIYCALTPIGYIQCYNAYEYPREGYVLENLPASLGAIDVFIGEAAYLHKGIGTRSVAQFVHDIVWQYFNHCYVDVDVNNKIAILTYQKAGFKQVKEYIKPAVIGMLMKK
ncbi:MAG: GNAT family N-acetyltransferase [Proteobacteria bacterium]|nr:GNAT family N-acetyltransferase [Pseudomonadota bacterium]